MKLGDLRAAHVALEAALRSPTTRSPAMLTLAADILRVAGHEREAFECLREAHDLDPANAEIARAAFDHAPLSERRVRAVQLLSLGPPEATHRPKAVAALLETATGIVWLTQTGASVIVEVLKRNDEEITLPILRRYGCETATMRPTASDAPVEFYRVAAQFGFDQGDFMAVEAPEGFIVFGSPVLSGRIASASKLTLRGAAVCIVVPLYRDDPMARICVESLLDDTDFVAGLFDVVLVDDSGDNALSNYARYQSPGCCLLTNPANLGFVGAVNYALSQLGDVDVLLLNADTLPPPGLARRLREVSAQDASIGLVTAVSNNAEYGCFPRPFESNPCPERQAALVLDAGFSKLHGVNFVEMPAATGFCLLITAACRRAVGLLDPGYHRGYLEDVDYCLRARRAGLRCVCALGVYVAHEGSTSFGAEKRRLVQWNARRLLGSHPQFQQELATFRERNVWLKPFERAERQFWPRQRIERLVVVGREMARAPGFDRVTIAAWLGTQGLVWCQVANTMDGGYEITVRAEDGGPPQSLHHHLPANVSSETTSACLAALDINEAIFLDPAATPTTLADAIRAVADRWSIAAIDLGLICPRGSAQVPTGRFCGIPALAAGCDSCIDRFGATCVQKIDAHAYRDYWKARFLEAHQVQFVDAQARHVTEKQMGRPATLLPKSKTLLLQSKAPGFAFLATRARLGSLRAFAILLDELKRFDVNEPEILIAGMPVTIEGPQASELNVIAPVAARDVAALLDRLNIGRIFVIDREATFNDPLVAAVVDSGRRIGGYGWGGTGAVENLGELVIDGFAPLPWAARTLSSWRTTKAAL